MTFVMEEQLAMPLKDVLTIIQNRMMSHSTYFGVKAAKSPTDAWIYHEILFETKPDVIIEIGNLCGGSTLKLAHFCDLLDKGRIIGIDISHARIAPIVRNHPRITLLEGDACSLIDEVKTLIEGNETVMIIEDSSHTYSNTLNVLRTFSPLVKEGHYFIVEDSICHHGLEVGPSPGPFEAIEKFISETNDFAIDRTREGFLITWNPKGFLRRVR